MKNPFLSTKHLLTETDARRLPPSLAEITFVGRSNVGKSSLICGLCENKKLARVSKTPGRTRGLNVFEVRRGRWLVDLPGFGYAEVPQKEREYWPKMIGGYLVRPQVSTVFVLMDAERGILPIDLSLLHWLKEKNISFKIVGTKVDRLNHSQQIESRKVMASFLELAPEEIFWVSGKLGYGLNELRTAVAQILGV